MRRACCLLCILLIAAGTLFPQAGEWYLEKKIKEIRFVGLVNVSKSELDGVVRSFIGQSFTDTLFWDLQSRLYALDYFEQFTPNALPGDESNQSVIIEFSVIERPIVDSIVITGNASIRKVDILDAILLKPDDIVTKTKVRLDSEAIKNLYIERGYPDIQVQGTITRNEENNTATVEFVVTEGSQTKVRTIAFVGNSYVSASTLKGLMTLKEQSFFSSGIFSESKLQEDLVLISTYYTDRGYVDAKIVNVERSVEKDPSDGRNYLVITITIAEGNQYTFGGMSFEGNELYSDEDLGKLVRLAEGSVLNLSRLQADYARVAGIYYDDGYIFNTITMKEIRDEINRSISFVLYITEKGKAHIENIIITGNTKTLEYVILRELPFTEGDVFSATKIREGMYNLQNLQFFSNITLDYPQGSSDGLMDLIINVEEGKTLDLNFGVTFTGTAGEFPVIGFVKVADSNFLGRGQELAATTQVSGDSQELTFSFLENWLFGKRWSGGVTLSFKHDTVSEVAQDILAPIFYYDFPDPYDGHYVFSDDTSYGGTAYEAGDAFPGIPTEEQIEEYDLLTDYDYADNEIPDTYLMTYETWEMSLGLSTGYKFYTPVGRFGVGTGMETSLKKVIYDAKFYRPFNPTTRENLNEWQPITKLWGSFSYDTRDLMHNPSSGVYFKDTATFTGGFLPSTRDYIKNQIKGEFFLTLFDIPAFKEWNFKMVLALRSSLSLVFDQYYKDDTGAWIWGTNTEKSDLLYVDGMITARGWNTIYYQRAIWDNWIELRIPLAEDFLWWDFFISATAPYDTVEGILDFNVEDFLFSFGGGARLTIPQLPIGLYLVKRFEIQDGAVKWQSSGSAILSPLDLDLVVSFNIDLF